MIDFSKIDFSKLDKTKTGRRLIYVNLALSLTFAFWALAIYANRVDWSDRKSGDEIGEYARLNDAVKQLDGARGPAEARLQSARTALAKLDDFHPRLQEWYANDLKAERSGNQPILSPLYAKGEPQSDNQGMPRMGPVLGPGDKPIRDLASIAKLEQLYTEKLEKIQAVTSQLDKLIADENQLSAQIGDGKAQGLRAELAAEQAKIKASLDSQENLKPQVYNRQVELALLLKRQRALEARVKELQQASLAH
jgi:hypothetical protein